MPVIAPGSKDTNLKTAYGVWTTVAASDTVPTGLKRVDHVVVSLESDPTDDPFLVTAVPGENGNITIKTWKNTGGTDPTPAAATTFAKKVHWAAHGV